MENQINQDREQDQEHTTFYDQADRTFNRVIEKDKKLAKGVTTDEDETEEEREESKLTAAEEQVRETEDASLQDDTYSFDESNTENEEYHDVDDADEYSFDSEDDFLH